MKDGRFLTLSMFMNVGNILFRCKWDIMAHI